MRIKKLARKNRSRKEILRNVLRRSSIVTRTALVFVIVDPSVNNEFLMSEQMF